MTENNSRLELEQAAIQLGHRADTVSRMTTYQIRQLLDAPGAISPARPQSVRGTAVTPEGSPFRRRMTTKRPPLADRVSLQGAATDEDVQTVVEIPAAAADNPNPADRKYERFKELVETRRLLLESLAQNQKLLDTYRHSLDEEDVAVINEDQQLSRRKVHIVEVEMHQLKNWFAEMHAEREGVYRQIVEQSPDVSGNLRRYFVRKLKSISHYMDSIQSSFAPAEEEVKVAER